MENDLLQGIVSWWDFVVLVLNTIRNDNHLHPAQARDHC
jgi:hypothetical protein